MVIPQCQFCLPKIRQEMRSYMSLSLHSAFISWILEPSPKGLIASRVFMSNPPCILGPTYLFICHLLRIVIKFWNVLLSIFYPIFFHEKLCQFCSCLFFSVFCLALKKHFFLKVPSLCDFRIIWQWKMRLFLIRFPVCARGGCSLSGCIKKKSFCFGFLWVPSVLKGKIRETQFF